jgi:hypothetical protein
LVVEPEIQNATATNPIAMIGFENCVLMPQP